MQFKKSMVLVLAASAMGLIACGPAQTTTSSSTGGKTESNEPATSSPAGNSSVSSDDKGEVYEALDPTYNVEGSQTITMDVGYDKAERMMKFVANKGALKEDPTYTGPDGTVYKAGDFKPAWQKMQENLNFNIDEVTDGTLNVQKRFDKLQTTKFHYGTADGKLVHIAQGNVDDIVSEGITNKTILDLSQHLDKMPAFKHFLDANPTVAQTVKDSEGHIFYTPYFDGYDDFEKSIMMRQSWVEKLLDGTFDGSKFDTDVSIDAHYQPVNGEAVDTVIDILNNADGKAATAKATVTKKHAKSVITLQNELANKNGVNLVKALRDYIDATYGGTYGEKRSELFIGGKAAYDVDELVALFRCVKANPGLLTGDKTKNMVPFTPREATDQRISDFWRFTQFFGVRGGESRNGYLFVGKDGKLDDVRDNDEMMNALESMHQMYQEGLILQDFNDQSKVTKKAAAQVIDTDGVGFALYDYVQTQTLRDETLKAKGMDLIPCLPAVFDWKKDGKQFHFTESWRSVKPNAWFITAETANTPALLDRCLTIFDYQFSATGNRLMSFGPDDYLKKDGDGKLATMDYLGRKIPVLSDDTLNFLWTTGKGNYTDFYRNYIGGTFPIGYVKEQGMEYQCTAALAQSATLGYEKAIELGVVQHSNHSTTNSDYLLDIVPSSLAYNSAEAAAIASGDYAALGTIFSVQSSTTSNVWNTVVKKGWDADELKSFNSYDLSRNAYKTTVGETLKLNSYVQYANDAYQRMNMNPRFHK